MTHKILFATAVIFFAALRVSGAPTVVSVSPASHSVSNPRNVDLVVTFGVPIDPLTITATSFQVFGRWSGVMSGTITMENGDMVMRFTPDRDFFAGELVWVWLSKGITDQLGDPMEKGYAWNFWAKADPGSMGLTEVDRVEVRADGEDWVQTYGVHGGDFNGDGSSDLAAPNEQTNDVRVFLNDTNGGYSGFTIFPLPGAGTPSPNEGADFNNDGKMDLAVGSGSGNTVNILLGDGTGAFSSSVAYTAASGVRGVAVQDLDGDGYSDVVTANRNGSNLSLLLNQGDGTFHPTVNMEGGGSQETACAAADANNDGIMDLFVGAYASNEVILLLGDGDGGLVISDEIPVGGSSPWMVAVGDVDGDGNVDAVSGNAGSNNVSVIRGDGAGNLLPATLYASGGTFTLAVDLGDLDGDGDLDLVVSNFGGTWRLYENNGAGIFINPQNHTASSAASCTIFHDRDNNGILDMTGVDEIDDLIFLFENTASPILCPDITNIQAKCQTGGTVLFRVVLLNSTEWAGTDVTCTLDGDTLTSTIVTNGTHSRASFSAPGPYGAGDHTITVIDPPCGNTQVVNCRASDSETSSIAWDYFTMEWEKTSSAEKSTIPATTEIVGSYPNPFNPTTTVTYSLGRDGWVTLKIYNMLGEEVVTVVSEFQQAGVRSATWDGRNKLGYQVSSGMYFMTLVAGEVVKTQKLLLAK